MKADKKKMFNSVLSSLGKYLFQGGNGNLAEDEGCMIQIPAGELYAMRSSLSGRSASIKECL